MSDASQGEGWWIASDGKWYPPESHPDTQQAAPPPSYEPPSEPSYEPSGYQPPAEPALQQPYQQSPGMPPPPTQPPLGATKPKRAWWKIALAVVLGGLLLIGGCTYAIFRAASGPIDTSNDFLALIKSGDFNSAADMLDPSCFADGGTAAALREAFPVGVTSYNLGGTSVNSTNGNTVGSSNGSITFTGDETRDINFNLNKNGDWEICGFQIGS